MFIKKYFKKFVKELIKCKIKEICCNEKLSVKEVTYFV